MTYSFLGTSLLFFLLIHLPQLGLSQMQSKKVGSMTVSWEHQGDQMYVKMQSPLKGWVAVGFNTKNDIVHTDLVMAAVKDGHITVEQFYVVGFGNPQSTEKLGGKQNINILKGVETAEGTQFEFYVATSGSPYHYELQAGKEIWLICAYSESDDFGHHSRMRKHIKVKL